MEFATYAANGFAGLLSVNGFALVIHADKKRFVLV